MVETDYKTVPVEENDDQRGLDDNPPKYGFGVRHVQGVLIFMCLTLAYEARGHLGVTIVGMTTNSSHIDTDVNLLDNGTLNNATEIVEGNALFNATDGNLPIDQNVENLGVYRTFNWPKSIQEMVLGSFFLGYCIMMFPMGLVIQRWGGKIPLQISMLVNGVLSFFTPWLVVWGDWKVLCAIRVLQGLSQAGTYPGIVTLVSNWIPVSERASLGSYIYTGSGVGTIIAFQLGGILAFSKFGWPSTFWVTGVACIVGFILITFFGAATPMEHKSISEAERNFILGTIKDDVKTKASVPWKLVFKSIPVWAAFITHVGSAVCFVFVFIQLPTYMFWVLKLDIRNSGILSSLPYLAAFFSSIAFGVTSDYLTNRNIISIKNARRLCNSAASIIPAICLALVTYTTNIALATTCLVICTAANAGLHSGWMVNYVDLSPNYSGALMATGNTMTNFVVLALPIIVSHIVTDVTNQLQWRITMFLMAALSLSSNIIFVLFMTSDVQSWNNSEDNVNKESEAVKLASEAIQKNSNEIKT